MTTTCVNPIGNSPAGCSTMGGLDNEEYVGSSNDGALFESLLGCLFGNTPDLLS